jgi:putative SOS response-associated peptidase YedK
LVKPAPEDTLNAWAVSRKVNSSKEPGEPKLTEPLCAL